MWLVVENVDDVGQELEKRISESPTTTTSPATYQKSLEELATCKNKREERRGEEDEKMRRRRLKKLDDEYGLCVAGADLMIRARMCVCAVLNLRKGRSWWWQEEEMPKGDWCPELLELVLLELE